ncbi:hypothetical protein A7E78_14445 [Syntrophotalea acetylenivorans]|uniref:Uncharacterized protein n=1 Tax=Syntrophotalea acetylenivorans TaxID=1842532 RepID=A0A1L3GSL9_9BACT|nr:hypothetical protein [Syntrophotalea acetylenivorans]APG28919.1 hypothetical protein A7E78_14445 [Syntrophotalea acetylenivorans]
MKIAVVGVLLVFYLAVWGVQQGKARWSDYYLSPAPPSPALKVASGYARQMAGYTLFVKVAIFAGGPLRGVDKENYADSLAQNFDVMTDLYPEFIDPFYYCQSLLAPIAPEYAQQTNLILDRGVEAHPDILFFPFFQAFNHFYYLQEPTMAAELFFKMGKRSDAPPWFGHLAGTLMGRGGNLLAGRSMLQAMFDSEQEEYIKERYLDSIKVFDQAIQVQVALDSYRKEHGIDAVSLQDLVPRYLDVLPRLPAGFMLEWEPPVLRLERP